MEVGKFLRWFLLSKATRKLHQLAMVIFVGSILGQPPSPWGIVGSLLFFAAYLTTYFYNDLIDYEDDRRKGSVYREKALIMGYATPQEYTTLLGNLSVAAIFLATLWDPLLGFFTSAAILLNNLRTHVKGVVPRQLLLILVELFNFEAFWNAFYGGSIPFLFVPLFTAYSSIYALGHGIYRLRKMGTFNKIVQSREIRNLLLITLAAVIFSLPVLVLSLYHFIILILGLVVYTLPMLRIVTKVDIGRQEGMNHVDTGHHRAITAVAIVLLLGALIYSVVPIFNIYIPLPKNYEIVARYFDELQHYIIGQVFGDLRGLRDKYDKNAIQGVV